MRRPKRGSIAPSIDLLLESAAERLRRTTHRGDPDRDRVRRLVRSVGRQAGGRDRRDREPGDAPCSRRCRPRSRRRWSTRKPISTSIAEVVVGLMQSTNGLPDGDEDDALHRLLDRIRDRSAIDFEPYKAATIMRRLRGRMNATGSTTVNEYAALAERDPAEYERLIGSLLIKVTEFFRDPKVWDHLRDDGPAGPRRGGSTGGPPAPGLERRLFVGRRGLFAGDHDRRGAGRPIRRSTSASSRPTSTLRRSPSPVAASTRPAPSRVSPNACGAATSRRPARDSRSSNRCARRSSSASTTWALGCRSRGSICCSAGTS